MRNTPQNRPHSHSDNTAPNDARGWTLLGQIHPPTQILVARVVAREETTACSGHVGGQVDIATLVPELVSDEMELDQLRDFIPLKVTPHGVTNLITQFLQTVGFRHDRGPHGGCGIPTLCRMRPTPWLTDGFECRGSGIRPTAHLVRSDRRRCEVALRTAHQARHARLRRCSRHEPLARRSAAASSRHLSIVPQRQTRPSPLYR